jgi:hypothetical protein
MKDPVISEPDFVPWPVVKKWAVFMAATCLIEIVMPQGYGKLGGDTVFQVPPRLGWWLLEIPVTVVFGYLWYIKGQPNSRMPVPFVLGCVLTGHYLCKLVNFF